MQKALDDAVLLPVVEVGNLGMEYLDSIYYIKKNDESLTLHPLLSLKTSLYEMYAGNSEYAYRLFYAANQIPRELVIKHIDKAITAKDIPEYLSSKKHNNDGNIIS